VPKDAARSKRSPATGRPGRLSDAAQAPPLRQQPGGRWRRGCALCGARRPVRAAKVTAVLIIKRCRTVLTERCRYMTGRRAAVGL